MKLEISCMYESCKKYSKICNYIQSELLRSCQLNCLLNGIDRYYCCDDH